MRVFGYGRVSTVEQTTTNQLLELKQAGYEIQEHRWFTDTISGSVQALERPSFVKLLDRLEAGDMLIVSKLDRLGRSMIDVLQTIELLKTRQIKLKVLALGDVDLSSPAGKLIISVLAATAELERDLLIERTKAGLERAKAEGKVLGRRSKTTEDQKQEILTLVNQGVSISQIARDYGISRMSVHNIISASTASSSAAQQA